jgi:hypothetical protein
MQSQAMTPWLLHGGQAIAKPSRNAGGQGLSVPLMEITLSHILSRHPYHLRCAKPLYHDDATSRALYEKY